MYLLTKFFLIIIFIRSISIIILTVSTYINGLNGVLYLIDSTFWRECVDTTIVVLLAIGNKELMLLSRMDLW